MQSQSLEVSGFLLDRVSTTSQSIEKLSFWPIDSRSIEVGFCLIATQQLLNLSKTLLHAFLSTCFASLYYLVIHSILFHYIHIFIWIPCALLIIFYYLYVSRVKLYSFLYLLSIMTKRGIKCGFFLRFYMLGGKIHAFVRGSCVSSC